MVYAYIQDVPIGEDLYRRIMDNLGPEPLAGSILHLCVRKPDGKLQYIDVWESEEAAREFGEKLAPHLQEAGVTAQPEVYEAHAFVTA